MRLSFLRRPLFLFTHALPLVAIAAACQNILGIRDELQFTDVPDGATDTLVVPEIMGPSFCARQAADAGTSDTYLCEDFDGVRDPSKIQISASSPSAVGTFGAGKEGYAFEATLTEASGKPVFVKLPFRLQGQAALVDVSFDVQLRAFRQAERGILARLTLDNPVSGKSRSFSISQSDVAGTELLQQTEDAGTRASLRSAGSLLRLGTWTRVRIVIRAVGIAGVRLAVLADDRMVFPMTDETELGDPTLREDRSTYVDSETGNVVPLLQVGIVEGEARPQTLTILVDNIVLREGN